MNAAEAVAAALAQAWRDPPPPGTLDEPALASALPHLLESGSAALAWRKARGSIDPESPVGHELREAYRLHTLTSAVRERGLCEAVETLRAEGIEPLLIKGWAVSRLYPEPGLRPWGDADLLVPLGELERAIGVLESSPPSNLKADLDDGYEMVAGWPAALASPEALLERAEVARLDGTDVRVPAPEDQLRLLAVHLLLHGGARPLWLCDVAVAVESAGPSFDWALCVGADPRRASWVLAVVELAGELLGASLDAVPVDLRRPLPPWATRAVLHQWTQPRERWMRPVTPGIATFARSPRGLVEALRVRWANPLEATVRLRASIGPAPRLPYQLAWYAWQALRYVPKAPRELAAAFGQSRAR